MNKEYKKISFTKARKMLKSNKRATPETAWIDMLFMANEDNCKYFVLGEEYQAKRGQIIANPVELSIRWRWGVMHVVVFICMLRGHGYIDVKDISINGFADVLTINILNLDKLIFDGKEKGDDNE